MNDNEILIRIRAAFETGGIEAAKREIDRLAAAQKSLNDQGGAGTQILQGMAGAMKGGATGANLLKGAVQGVGSAFHLAAPEINLVLMALQVGLSVWQLYKRHSEEAAEAARKAAEKQAAAAKEAQKRLEELGKTRLDAAKAAADELKAALKAAADEAARAKREMDELDDAEASRDLARIDLAEAKGELTGDEANARRAEIRADAADRKSEREAAALDAEEKRLADAYAAAAAEAAEAAKALADAEKDLAEAKTELAAARRAQNRSTGWIAAGEAAERVKNARAGVRAARASEEEARTNAITAKAREEEAAAQQAAALPEIEHKRAVLAANREATGFGREEALATYERESGTRIARDNAGRYADRVAEAAGESELQALFDEAATALADFPEELGKVVDAIRDRREELEKASVDEAKAAADTAKRREELDRVETGPAAPSDPWTRIGAFSAAASGTHAAILKEQNAHLKAIELYTRLISRKTQTGTVTL